MSQVFLELLEKAEEKIYFQAVFQTGSQIEHGKNYGETTFNYATQKLTRYQNRQNPENRFTPGEIMSMIEIYLENSQDKKGFQGLHIQDITIAIRNVLSPEFSENLIQKVVKKYKDIDLKNDPDFIEIETPVTSFKIENYTFMFAQGMHSMSTLYQVLDFIQIKVAEHKEELHMDNIVGYRINGTYPKHQYYCTSSTEFPVSSQMMFNIFDSLTKLILEKKEWLLELTNDKKITDETFLSHVKDVITYHKLNIELQQKPTDSHKQLKI